MNRLPHILLLVLCGALAFVPAHAQVEYVQKATATADGLMRKEDKAKVDNVRIVTCAADYTGWYRVAGTGTNDAAAIQAVLDAAYAQKTPPLDQYTYLESVSEVVQLPPGKKIYVAGTGTDPVLVVPQGVTLDLNGSTLFVSPPATATNQWAAVVLKHAAKLKNGKIFVVSGAVWPGYATGDYRLAYDGVRIFESDGDASVTGCEIKGFRGACVRAIGSWNTDIVGNRFLNSSYGVVLSKLGDAFTASAYARRRPSTNDKCTSTYVKGNRFTNLHLIGLWAGASGDASGASTSINFDDFAAHTTALDVEGNYFENNSSYAIYCLASWPKLRGNTYENCGNVNGVLRFDTCKSPSSIGDEYIRTGSGSLTRHSNTAVNDTVVVNPAAFIRATGSGTVTVGSLVYQHNQSATMTFVHAISTKVVAFGVTQAGTFAFTGTDGDITVAPDATSFYASGGLVAGTVNRAGNVPVDTAMTFGAGQDTFALKYDHASGKIKLAADAGGPETLALADLSDVAFTVGNGTSVVLSEAPTLTGDVFIDGGTFRVDGDVTDVFTVTSSAAMGAAGGPTLRLFSNTPTAANQRLANVTIGDELRTNVAWEVQSKGLWDATPKSSYKQVWYTNTDGGGLNQVAMTLDDRSLTVAQDLTAGGNLQVTGTGNFDNTLTVGTTAVTLSNGGDVTATGKVVALNHTYDTGTSVDNGASVVVAGAVGRKVVTTDGQIVKWYVNGDVSGDVTFEVKKNGVSMTGTGTKPNLTAQQDASGTSFTNWTSTTVVDGDVLEFEITGTPASVKRVTLTLKIRRT